MSEVSPQTTEPIGHCMVLSNASDSIHMHARNWQLTRGWKKAVVLKLSHTNGTSVP